MSDSNEKFKYHQFELTMQGYALRQQAIAGGIDKPVVFFTRGALGEGRPENEDDVVFLQDMVQHRIDIPVKESKSEKANHMISLVIDSIELALKEDFLASEIGIFAQLVNGKTGDVIIPEILYGYTYTDGYDYIPDDSFKIYRELTFNTVISKASSVVVEYDRSQVYVTHQEFADAVAAFNSRVDDAIEVLKKVADEGEENIDNAIKNMEEKLSRAVNDLEGRIDKAFADHAQEIKDEVTESIKDELDEIINNGSNINAKMFKVGEITHHQNRFPGVVAFEIIDGYGLQGYGETIFGGDYGETLKAEAKYLGRNTISVSVNSEDYKDANITEIAQNEYLIVSVDSQKSAYISLI